MPDEIAPSETEGLEAVEGVTGDEIGLAPDFFSNEDTETPEAETGTEDGLPQVSEDDQAVEEVAPDATEPTPEEPVSEEPEQPAAYFKYGDKEFTDPDSITNFIKTIEGRQRNTQANAQDALTKNEQWITWSKDPAKLRERLAELEGVKPEEVKVTDEKQTFLEGTDWKQLKALVDSGRGMEALAMLQSYNDKVLEQRIAQVEQKFSGKIQPMTEAAEAREATVSLFTQAENATDPRGNLIWPEFNTSSEQYDPQFCQLAVQVWKDLPASIAWDPSLHGLEIAYNRVKAFMASQASSQAPEEAPTETESAAPNPAEGRVRDAQGRFVKQTEAQATAVGGSGATPPPTKGPADSFSEAAIIASMDRAHNDIDPVFGIRR